MLPSASTLPEDTAPMENRWGGRGERALGRQPHGAYACVIQGEGGEGGGGGVEGGRGGERGGGSGGGERGGEGG